MMSGLDGTTILLFANELVTAATAVLAFSLAVYILAHNFRSTVAWGFIALLGSLLIVYIGDLVVPYVTRPVSAQRWLRLQWLGIAFMPAAYLHLSHGMLQAAGYPSYRRSTALIGSYVLSAFLVTLAWFTDLLVLPGHYAPPINQLASGPIFPFFVAYYAFTIAYGTYNVYQARQKALTQAARRRITRMAFAFTMPGLAVFPYLIITSSRSRPLVWSVLSVTLLGNMLVAVALLVMAYTVAYYGVLTPERVVKRNLVRFLLNGPALAVSVVITTLILLRLDTILNVPREVLVIFSVTGLIVIGQGILHILMPWVDRLVYPQDRQELSWLEELDRRLITSSDLHQFLTNTLLTLCETLRADHGFVLTRAEQDWRLQAAYGPVGPAFEMLTAQHLAEILRQLDDSSGDERTPFTLYHNYLIAPLRPEGHGDPIGLVGIATNGYPELTAEQREIVHELLTRARAAVEDHYLQRQIFALVQETMPTIVRLQQLHSTSTMAPATSPALHASDADFVSWVRDALRHFWGGPKLSENPLLDLQVVAETAEEKGTPRTRALQNVLLEAIERLRPAGQRKMTTSEWLLYNILDLKFIQGKRVRDIAQRLAMSESDLYRKQRVAIAEVARILKEMEAQRVVTESGNGQTRGKEFPTPKKNRHLLI